MPYALEERVRHVEYEVAELRQSNWLVSQQAGRTQSALDRYIAEATKILKSLSERIDRTQEQIDRTSASIDRLSERVDRTSASVDRLSERIDRTQEQVDRTSQEVSNLSKTLAEERKAWREELARERKAWREEMRQATRKWGEVSNKMGRLAEDFVAPSVPRILREVVGCPEDNVEHFAVRVRRRHPQDRGRSQEFDVLAACGDYVLINETKSSLDPKDVDDFVKVMQSAREFFPEYAERRFIGAIASLYVDDSVVRYGQKRGVLVLGLGDEMMEVLNSPGFKPREF